MSPSLLGGAINGMEDCDASKIRMANQATVIVEVVKGGIDTISRYRASVFTTPTRAAVFQAVAPIAASYFCNGVG